MKKLTDAGKVAVVAVVLIILAAVGGYKASSFIMPIHAAEEEEEPKTWQFLAAEEVFKDEMLNDLEEDFIELKEDGFTDYSYTIEESIDGIYRCQVDLIHNNGTIINVVMLYDVYEDDGFIYCMIDGERMSADAINNIYDF